MKRSIIYLLLVVSVVLGAHGTVAAQRNGLDAQKTFELKDQMVKTARNGVVVFYNKKKDNYSNAFVFGVTDSAKLVKVASFFENGNIHLEKEQEYIYAVKGNSKILLTVAGDDKINSLMQKYPGAEVIKCWQIAHYRKKFKPDFYNDAKNIATFFFE